MREHHGGAEPRGQLRLRVEARDHRHLDVGIERAQDGDRAQPERAGAPTRAPGPPRGGGCRVIACSDTENGSANTACSSGTESGTANSMLSWAGISSA